MRLLTVLQLRILTIWLTLCCLCVLACRFSNTVDRSDVTEALRLMLGSKASLTEGGGAKRAADEDPVSLCYRYGSSLGLCYLTLSTISSQRKCILLTRT